MVIDSTFRHIDLILSIRSKLKNDITFYTYTSYLFYNVSVRN